jgi:hypothetical protein
MYIILESANAEAEQAFDSAKGLNGAPSTKVLNGREAKFKVGVRGTERQGPRYGTERGRV